jgi:hypothetical protein
VVENVPAVVDMISRAKGKLRAPITSKSDIEERLRLLQEENQKLAKVLLDTSDHLQELGKGLEVMAARQKMLTIAAVVSLLLAASSLLLWFVR